MAVTRQKILQAMAGVSSGTEQEIINTYGGFGANQFPAQAALNLAVSRGANSLNTKQAYYNNVSAHTSLGPISQYTIQDILEAARTAGLNIMQVVQGSAYNFDPTSSITWRDSYWAEGTQGTPFVADTNVAQWDDNSGGGMHLVNGTAATQPVYRASVTGLNNRPALQFTSDWIGLDPATFGTIPQPFSIVAIMQSLNVDATTDNVVGPGDTSTVLLRKTSGGNWQAFNTGTINNGTVDTNPHLMAAVHNNASSAFFLDGITNTGNFSSGTGLAGITLSGSNLSATTTNQYIAFIGIYTAGTGDVRDHAQWNNFKAWAQRYGIALA